jgi:hypothetical protein
MTLSACEHIYLATDAFVSRFVVSAHLQAMRPRYRFVRVNSLEQTCKHNEEKMCKCLIVTKSAVRFSVKCTWVNTKNGKKAIPLQAVRGPGG